ncbi:protein DpdH [Terrabacter sp. Root181]|uniref:protein DpdH n=1 Tax=Terrabacter sp. Root181 TaxID=1736484 RepID=UPI0006F25368|nr:protein DpdH [Terrabacter sp. Root181]KRB47075.1 hypothetical protein ASD90_01440 [Terrabacter sp. Root181]
MTVSESFSQYLCWNPSEVEKTVFVDAVSPSDAVFLATHQPMRIIRTSFTGSGDSKYVTEQELLQEFLRENESMMLLPIRGESGAGKSHLVRWMGAKIGDGNERRRVIYVPKYGTNLRKVIELILDKMEGDEVPELRAALHEATTKLDEKAAPSALLAALADRIEYSNWPSPATSDTQQTKDELQTRLPVLLRDVFFRDWFLRKDGLIAHFVHSALSGTRQGDHEKPFEFTTDELPTRLDDRDAARAARDVNYSLKYPTAARIAVEMMTTQLGPAIQTVFGLEGAVSLTDVMMETRRTLAKQDMELVLLIEDFTILQGIQRELLDAIVEPTKRPNEPDLCGIRTTLAVTSGYFDSLADTIKTRAAFASHVYDLNVPFSSGDTEGERTTLDFVGRYLNATRVGSAGLEAAWNRSKRIDADWIPNACEGCGFKKPCHESFGQTSDGYGLYPFNDVAVKRTVYAVTSSSFFDPRAVLGQVIRRTIEAEAADIKNGLFPSKEYGQSFVSAARPQKALPANVSMAVNDFPSPERRRVLLTLWGDSPDSIVNLPPGIHSAFSIPIITEVPTETPEWHETEAASQPTLKPDGSSERSARQIELIDQWATGNGLLDADIARELRQYLADALRTRVDWDITLMRPGAAFVREAIDQASFEIDQAAGGRSAGPRVWKTSIGPSEISGAILRAIVQHRTLGSWVFPGGPDAYRRLCNLLDSWAVEVVDHCRRLTDVETGASLATAMQALVVGAAFMGVAEAASDDPLDLLSAAFTPKAQAHLHETIGRDGATGTAARAAIEERRNDIIERVLLSYGARQGGGAMAHAIDAVPMLQAIEDLVSLGDNAAPAEEASPFVAGYAKALLRQWSGPIALEVSQIRIAVEQINSALGGTSDLYELGNLLADAARAAGDVKTFYPGHEMLKFTQECEALTGAGTLDAVYDIEDHLKNHAEGSERATLVWLATRPTVRLSPLRTFLIRAGNVLGEAHQRGQLALNAQSGSTGVGDSHNAALEQLVRAMRRAGGIL